MIYLIIILLVGGFLSYLLYTINRLHCIKCGSNSIHTNLIYAKCNDCGANYYMSDLMSYNKAFYEQKIKEADHKTFQEINERISREE